MKRTSFPRVREEVLYVVLQLIFGVESGPTIFELQKPSRTHFDGSESQAVPAWMPSSETQGERHSFDQRAPRHQRGFASAGGIGEIFKSRYALLA